MRRREFIGLVGSAVIVWPQYLLAQERKKIQLVGVLANEAWPPLDGLRHGLRDLGYIGGRGFNIVYRFAEGQAERYPVLATELVASWCHYDLGHSSQFGGKGCNP